MLPLSCCFHRIYDVELTCSERGRYLHIYTYTTDVFAQRSHAKCSHPGDWRQTVRGFTCLQAAADAASAKAAEVKAAVVAAAEATGDAVAAAAANAQATASRAIQATGAAVQQAVANTKAAAAQFEQIIADKAQVFP